MKKNHIENKMIISKIYNFLPIFIQDFIVSIKGWLIYRRRYNKNFKLKLGQYLKNDCTQVDVKQLRKFLEYANTSKFWKKKFEEYDVDIYAEFIIDELKKLPVLTKQEVKENIKDIILSVKGEKVIPVATSGTTGSGLKFTQTLSMENAQWAVWWRYRMRHGIALDTWMGWFGGKLIIDRSVDKPPYWRINRPGKQVMFSAIHLSINTVDNYYSEIKRRNLRWLHGYPSHLALFASLIKEKGLPCLNLDFVTLGAESLLEHQNSLLKEVFGMYPLQHYGLAEGVANISQLPNGKLVPDMDFALCEFVPTSNDQFKIIGTNYNNLSFPLIRYDTNDLVSLDKEGEIQAIDGRKDDYIVLPTGEKIGRLGFIFKDAIFVKEAQIYQMSLNLIYLRIVKGNDYNEKIHEDLLIRNCRERFGNTVDISFEYLDSIPKTKSGKLKYVISEIK